jgi:hypothetical protein
MSEHSSAANIRLAREKASENHEADLATLSIDRQTLLVMPEFKRYMRDLMTKGGLMQSVMTGNSQTFYKAGQQDFARQIWAELAAVDNVQALKLLEPFGEKNNG